ncbi:bifunctional hydroxymethylpyrimidine kinase/phosphomethylpyrimidine kinase [Corynebacterium yudongzhengii]|uniref:Thiamine biosynthesis multifunctional protein ThiED n=1 Tax=Corynebacterium yudongzhengii TaxID=2080740 RepID=A0A2U1T5Q4_9CORY|nr:bifunctional hydroxymethylpyrimidine kinase/phosphomethylpyrimidine kinase [Corynebacterium yudongzhengii]AWB82616.1 bifunctional hydroxymethylpyrimidine kinase/phosphomethylpyrimidine kinase [Corynebacterium yudongzhengii]PWC01350.1 bifunctional hydroxymethylpyrimidine kinase/phosphomethylpyrimidine kinase [Corynebacterium yudongzhengii]
MDQLVPRVLSIAGTDPTGGAGIQADLKAIAAAGGFGMSVVTSLVVQNTRGVQSVHTPEPDFLRAQLKSVSDDVTIDAVKIGMIADEASAREVVAWLEELGDVPVVIDPVMVAASGHALAESVSGELLKKATVLTPNLTELAQLTGGKEATTRAEANAQATTLADTTGALILAKGGHLSADDRGNTLIGPGGEVLTHASSPAVETSASHGTGCSLSSALATRLAVGESYGEAVAWATDWVREALEYGEDLQVGQGNGPIDHFHRLRRQAAASDQRPRLRGFIDAWEAPEALGVDVDTPAPTPVVAPAGPWTAALWEAAGDALQRFTTDGFVPALASGVLPQEKFLFYLTQDDYYLEVYSRVLAGLGLKAENREERRMWAESVTEAIAVEQGMHAQFGVDAQIDPSPATLAYTDFLRAEAQNDYPIAVAAVLPCFWVYAQVGADLASARTEDHPYASWLGTYEDAGFQEATARAVAVAEKALAGASARQRARAAQAFVRACELEADFFAQAMLTDAR